MIDIEVRLFGAFRRYEKDGPRIQLSVPVGTTVEQVKEQLALELRARFPAFSDDTLIRVSAIADDRSVLDSKSTLSKSCSLAILPPVCGG